MSSRAQRHLQRHGLVDDDGPSRGELEGRLEQTGQRARRRGRRISGQVDRRRERFDPTEGARATAQAAFEDFQEQHERGIEGLRGQQAGMGRLRTGFATEDEDRLTEDLQGRLARELARGAFTAQSQELQHMDSMAADAHRAQTRGDAALAGQLDRADRAEQERRSRRGRILGILGAGAGAAIGGLASGGAGAALGARVGGQLGNLG